MDIVIWVWFSLAIIAIILEMFTGDLAFAMIAIGLAAAGLTSAFGTSLIIEVLVAAVVVGVGFVFLRPWILKHRRQTPLTKTNTSAMIGESATVVQEVTEDAGLVKFREENWSARIHPVFVQEGNITVGEKVRVEAVDGAYLLVVKRPNGF